MIDRIDGKLTVIIDAELKCESPGMSNLFADCDSPYIEAVEEALEMARLQLMTRRQDAILTAFRKAVQEYGVEFKAEPEMCLVSFRDEMLLYDAYEAACLNPMYNHIDDTIIIDGIKVKKHYNMEPGKIRFFSR